MNFIINPLNNKKVVLNSKEGIHLLKKYISFFNAGSVRGRPRTYVKKNTNYRKVKKPSYPTKATFRIIRLISI